MGRPHRTIGPASNATGEGRASSRERSGTERNFPGEPGVLAAILPFLIVIGVCVRHPVTVLATRFVRAAVAVALLAGLVTTPALAVEPPAGLTIEAKVLVAGHVRVGSWMAIDIHVANTGPAISGELRLAGGAQGRTRFGTRSSLHSMTSTGRHHTCVLPPPKPVNR